MGATFRVSATTLFMGCNMLNQFWTPLLTLLGVIVGALLTGILSLLNSYFQATAQTERERNKLILEKLEELFGSIEILRIHYKNSFLTHHRYLILTEDLPKAVAPEESNPMVKILGLASFYAPDLKTQLNQMVEDASAFSKFQKEVLLYLSQNKVDQSEVDRITSQGKTTMEKINKSCLDMQEEITDLSKNYL